MQQSQEDKDSLLKAARLVSAIGNELDVDLIERILKTKGDINYQIPKHFLSENHQRHAGGTALHFTKYCTQPLKIIQIFLKYGSDITIRSDEQLTVLHEVIGEPNVYKDYWALHGKLSDPVVNEILSKHVKQSITKNPGNRYGLTHFHVACMADHLAAVELFINNGCPVDMVINEDSPILPKCTPLQIAVRCSALKVFEVLLKHGANQYLKDKKGLTVLHWLIERNRRLVDFETLERKDISMTSLTELQVNQQMLKLLFNSKKIESLISKDQIGLSDLHVACALGNSSNIVEQILPKVTQIDHQVNENSPLSPGYTALHFAAHFSMDNVKLLLSKGANIMIKNKNGYTPFDICLERYAIEKIHSLMSTKSEWTSITLLDGKIKLLDLVLAMQNINEFRSFIYQYIKNVNISVDENSCLWPGFTLLHLAVILSEQTKNRYNYTYKVSCNVIETQFNPNVDVIEDCLVRGADVTAQDFFGFTPLHLAFRYQKTETIKKLLEFHRSTANPIDKYNVSHLHIACAADDLNVVEKLLQPGVNLNLPLLSDFKFHTRIDVLHGKLYVAYLPTGSTPLHVAIACRSYGVTKLLVDNGADVNAVDANGLTPIHRLLVDPRPKDLSEICKVLLSTSNLKEVVVADSGFSHLFVASYFDNVAAVKRLLNLGVDIDERLGSELALDDFAERYGICESGIFRERFSSKISALHDALTRESKEIASLLVEHGADILARNSDGKFLLYKTIGSNEACFAIFVEIVSRDENLTRRIEDETGLTAIHIAAYRLDTTTVKRLIETGTNVNAQANDKAIDYVAGCTPLHLLMMKYRHIPDNDSKRDSIVEIMKLLLAAGADVMIYDAEFNTPVHSMAKYWICMGEVRLKFVGLMFNTIKDFHVNPVDKRGLSFFHIACLQNNVPIIKKYLDHGVDINTPINLFLSGDFHPGSTALHLIIEASKYDNLMPRIETIDFLLEHGADVNAQDIQENTPLHSAVQYASGRVDVFQRLIKAKADLNKQNALCETPFEKLLLSNRSTLEGIKLFIQHGCKVNGFNSFNQQGYMTRLLCILYDERSDAPKIWTMFLESPDIIKSDAKGRTPIHNIVSVLGSYLVSTSIDLYSAIIARFCRMSCDIDAQDESGQTALHFAARFKNNLGIVALLRNGADINVVDKFGKTAISYGFESFESRTSNEEDLNLILMENFYIYMKKLQYLKLSLNDINKNLLSKILLQDVDLERLTTFAKEIDETNTLRLEEGSISFTLKDLLSETGVVTVYPLVETVRILIDRFFKNIDSHFFDYYEIVDIYKLQFRKAVKIMAMIQLAKDCLRDFFPLPDICCNNVIKFLSNADLENLILSTEDG